MPTLRAESLNCRSALADRKLVPDDQVKIFCEILHFRHEHGERCDTNDGRSIYRNRLRPLLPKLKFPISSKPGVAWKLILPKQSEYCSLCDLHENLNADFVHQWFKFLALEVGARLEILRASNGDHLGKYVWNEVIKPLTRLHKIWETENRIQEAFGDLLSAGPRGKEEVISVERQIDRCEACVLARVGSHGPTLFALRAVVKSRISLESSAKHPSRLRLLRLIDPWIENWQARLGRNTVQYETRRQAILDNTDLAAELFVRRKEMEIYLHEVQRAESNKGRLRLTTSLGDDATKDILFEAEHDIIDSYAALRATQRQSQLLRAFPINQKERMTANYVEGERNQRQMQVDTAYRESRYSIDTLKNNERIVKGRSAVFADATTSSRSRQTNSAQTCWNDVIAGGKGMGNPFTPKLDALPKHYREPTGSHLSSSGPGVHETVRTEVSKPEIKHDYKEIGRSGDARNCTNLDPQAIFKYQRYDGVQATNRISAADRLVSPLSHVSMRDSRTARSSVSSTYTYEKYYED